MKKLMTILAALTVLTICSCEHPAGTSALFAEKESSFYAMSPPSQAEPSLESNEQKTDNVKTVERKIIKEGEIRFETADINKTKSLIAQTVQELNGYIAKDNAYDYSDRLEHRLVIRVPADKFDLLLKNISEGVDKFDRKSIDVLDVTEEFIDLDARIKTKKDLQNRYREILQQATKVEEILNIEKEIGNLQTEIESVEGRMRYLKDSIAFSTLTVVYYQKIKASSTLDFVSELTDGIKNGWEVFLWFIIGLSYLWVFIVIAIVTVYGIIRRRRQKKTRS